MRPAESILISTHRQRDWRGLSQIIMLATADAARGLTVGVHGTTFGGNPLAMAVGNATLNVMIW